MCKIQISWKSILFTHVIVLALFVSAFSLGADTKTEKVSQADASSSTNTHALAPTMLSTRYMPKRQIRIDNIHEVAVTPDGKELWAYGVESPSIAIVDINSPNYEILGEINLPGEHRAPISHIIFDSEGRYAYLANSVQCVYERSCEKHGDHQNIIVVDIHSKSIVSTIPLQEPFYPTGSLAISHDDTFLYLTVADYANRRAGIYKLNLQSQEMVSFLELPGANYITLSLDGRYLYSTQGLDISGSSPDLFSTIDIESFQVISSTSVGNKPQYIALTPDGKKAYVSNQLSNDISVIDLSVNEVRTIISVGSAPREIAILPNGKKAYVGNTGISGGLSGYQFGNTVSVLDIENDLFVKDIPVGLEPQSVVIDPDGKKAYVSDGNANGIQPAEVHVINTVDDVYERAIILRKAAFYTPTSIDVTPDGRKIFVISEATEKLLTIDAEEQSIIASHHIAPRAVKVSRNGQLVYVYSPQYPRNGEGRFFIIDVDSLEIQQSIDLGMITSAHIGDQRALRIVLDSDEKTAYLAGGDGDEVIVLDLISSRIVARIRIGAEGHRDIVPARGIDITPDDRKLFVSSCVSKTVSVVDTITYALIDTIQVANCPSEIKVSQDGSKVYVLQQHTTSLMTIINANTHQLIKVIDFPSMIAAALDFSLSTNGRYAYIVCFDPNWIMVYDLEEKDPGKAVSAVIKTGLDPFNLAADVDNRYLYVTELTSDAVTIIDTQINQIVKTIPLQGSW